MVTANTGNVLVEATSDVRPTTLAGGGALGLGAGIGASVASAFLQDRTEASVGSSQINATAGDVRVRARGDHTMEGAAIAGSASIIAGQAAFRIDITNKSVLSTVDTGADVHAFEDVVVDATSSEDINALAASLGIGLLADIAAAATSSVILSQTWASIDGGSVRADGNILVDRGQFHKLRSVGWDGVDRFARRRRNFRNTFPKVSRYAGVHHQQCDG